MLYHGISIFTALSSLYHGNTTGSAPVIATSPLHYLFTNQLASKSVNVSSMLSSSVISAGGTIDAFLEDPFDLGAAERGLLLATGFSSGSGM